MRAYHTVQCAQISHPIILTESRKLGWFQNKQQTRIALALPDCTDYTRTCANSRTKRTPRKSNDRSHSPATYLSPTMTKHKYLRIPPDHISQVTHREKQMCNLGKQTHKPTLPTTRFPVVFIYPYHKIYTVHLCRHEAHFLPKLAAFMSPGVCPFTVPITTTALLPMRASPPLRQKSSDTFPSPDNST